jgi:hypothetical protein
MTHPDADPQVTPAPPVPVPSAPPAAPGALLPALPASWLAAITVGLAALAGLAAWPISEFVTQPENRHFLFRASEKAAADPYNFVALNRETALANGINGAIAFGGLGALLGLGLGLAGGLARRSLPGAALGAGVGLVLGAAAGALPSFPMMKIHWYNRHEEAVMGELAIPFALMIHAGLWCALGAAAGLAYGVGRYGRDVVGVLVATIGGLIGATLGVIAFEVIGSMAFPLARTVDPFSESSLTRLLARLCVAVFTALGVLAVTRIPRKRAAVAEV